MKKLIFTVTFGLLLLAYGCSDQGEEVISGVGTITYSALEGGCWGINLDQGISYEVYDLPESFRQDGLRVKIAAKLSRGQVSYCYSGNAIIDIIELHRL